MLSVLMKGVRVCVCVPRMPQLCMKLKLQAWVKAFTHGSAGNIVMHARHVHLCADACR